MIRANLRRLLLASVATLGSAFAAHAQMPLPSLEPAPPLTGLYIGGGAGFNWMQNQHLINATGTAGNAVPAIALRVCRHRQHRLGLAQWYTR